MGLLIEKNGEEQEKRAGGRVCLQTLTIIMCQHSVIQPMFNVQCPGCCDSSLGNLLSGIDLDSRIHITISSFVNKHYVLLLDSYADFSPVLLNSIRNCS